MFLALIEGEVVVGVDVDFGASSRASGGFGVPHAASIEDAGTLSGVENGAVAEAALGGHVPGALRRASTLAGIGDGEAAEEALGVLLIPFAG